MIKVTFSLNERIIKMLDEICVELETNKSDVLRRIIEDYYKKVLK